MNWAELERLRNLFLSETFSDKSDYWNSSERGLSTEELIAQYDRTFAERIGWKWDAVLSELKERAWKLPDAKFRLLDWGCGTGIASRRFLEHFGSASVQDVLYFDRSSKCVQYAREKQSSKTPELSSSVWKEGETIAAPFVLLLSHVLNELSENKLDGLRTLCKKAEAVLWVEPGAFESSRKLVSVRESVLGDCVVVAPCTHQKGCGLLTKENERHWCHHFAKTPTSVFHDAFWSEFSRRLKIDLRRLPVSFLVLEKKKGSFQAVAKPQSRVIGRPRLYKGNGKFLLCDETGVKDTLILEKNQRELFKEHERDVFYSVLNSKISRSE